MLRKSAAPLPDVALDALGNPERRRLLEALARGPVSVGELAAGFPISRPAVSRHLRQLEQAGLVMHRVEGTRHLYMLDPDGLERTRAWLNSFWDEAAARLRLVAHNSRPRPRPPHG
ncbi:MAG TPA: metalloregulator ArsR/SmtB family transcription factor [Devosia sp.]|nr:metalloregulator ArsR/SmtB family transcription factor [Devosia sp.]